MMCRIARPAGLLWRNSGLAQPAARGVCSARSRIENWASTVGTQYRAYVPASLADLALETAAPITEAKALHPRFYFDQQYLAAERQCIFGSQWFAVAHTSELSSHGDVKVVEVGGTSILLTCDDSGKLHAFYNVCEHKEAQSCFISQKGYRQLVCPYHGWAYRLDGSLKSTSLAENPNERRGTFGLQRVPGLETFAGMVFINQNPNPPPLSDTLGDLPNKLARYDLDHMEMNDAKDYTVKGDWKLVAENFVDFYSINAVHPELAKFSRVDDHLPYQGKGQYIGFVTAPLTDRGGPAAASNFNGFPRLSKLESSSALFFQIFPNVSVTIYPHSVYTLMTFPTATPGVTKERLSLLMGPTARKQGEDEDTYRKKCKNLMDFVVKVNDEDVVAVENLQQGFANAPLHHTQDTFVPAYDWPVHRFQNMVIGGLRGASLDEAILPNLCTTFEEQVART